MKSLSKRDWFTIAFWILFIAGLVCGHIIAKYQGSAFCLDFFGSVLFGKFMIVRMHRLDGLDWSCSFGWHDHDYKPSYYMRGTGQYIGGEEIQKKVSYESSNCSRCGTFSSIP